MQLTPEAAGVCNTFCAKRSGEEGEGGTRARRRRAKRGQAVPSGAKWGQVGPSGTKQGEGREGVPLRCLFAYAFGTRLVFRRNDLILWF